MSQPLLLTNTAMVTVTGTIDIASRNVGSILKIIVMASLASRLIS